MQRTVITALGLLFLFVGTLSAQDPIDDDSTLGWKKSAIVGLSITQAAYSNWNAGGDDTYSGKGSGDVLFEHFSEKFYVANLLQLAYGRRWTESDGWRKIDDVIRYNFLIAYRTHTKLLPTFVVDFRTQFDDGFDYDLDEENGVRISTFMAPGYLTETAGVLYQASSWLETLFGVAAKQTFVLEESLRDPNNPAFESNNGYGNDPDQAVRNEVGLNLAAVAKGEVVENVFVRSELGVFAAFNQMDNPDIRWNNVVQMSVNEWLNTTFEFELFYDNDQSSDLQLRETLAVGVAFNLL